MQRRRSMAAKPQKHRWKRRLSALFLLVLAMVLYLRWENTTLQVTEFDVSFSQLPHGFDGCRIAVLSDLHGAEFGKENEQLFAAVAAARNILSTSSCVYAAKVF